MKSNLRRDAVLVLVALISLAGFSIYISAHTHPLAGAGDVIAPLHPIAPIYPDPVKTPGVTNPNVTEENVQQTICVKGWTATIRPPASYTSALKLKQLASGYALYGDMSPASYEEDHFISLELGGNPTDSGNLWPQPYSATTSAGVIAGAHQKDLVENYLKKQVCSGQMSLFVAQRLIVNSWYNEYLSIAKPGSVGGGESGDPDDE